MPHQSGKIAIENSKVEFLFVTLDKADGCHDRISYRDYAISPEIFHWQTQNNAGPDTPAGRRYIGSASILRDGRVVFNIGGNKYRLVVWINYPYRVVYVRFVGTHARYDRIDAQTV